MVSFKSLLLLATAALVTAKPLAIRSFDADLVLLDLGALDTSVKGLTSAIEAYDGGVVQATPILTAFSAVHVANRKCYDTCGSVKNMTSSDSYTIIDYVTRTLALDIPAGIKALEAKKDAFVASDLQYQVVSSLDLLKYDHESLSQALAKKESQEQDVQLKTYVVVKEIDDAIVGGISYFQ
ncbi:uncharacterized protein LY89DRAFT_79897 [Mollisia scopiformis]|uniref:Uncharacterized protein n=1 Tax=Mollisia scopiformis TaxID=149040 RepID=A0A194X827_MOLSC|nr:uncharacterized protein LY89DRAFT_79897 [Mollisia scopiformis]KUJ16315.1 hypothetical protein LY89DRAFT_79897 [Mollisia scopiformis]